MAITNKDHVKLLKRLVNATGKNQGLEMGLFRESVVADDWVEIKRYSIDDDYTVTPRGNFDCDGIDYNAFCDYISEPSGVEFNLRTPEVISEFLVCDLPSWFSLYKVAQSVLSLTEEGLNNTELFTLKSEEGVALYRPDLITDVVGLKHYCNRRGIDLQEID